MATIAAPTGAPWSDDDLFIKELERAAGVGIHKEVPALREELQPICAALPTSNGRLSATAVRYALHRLLRQRHGWLVEGLDPEGRAWNGSWPTKTGLLARLAPEARALLERQLSGPGLGLSGAAGLAALVEALARTEAAERMRVVVKKWGAEVEGGKSVPLATARLVAQSYTAAFVLSKNPANSTKDALWADRQTMHEVMPAWGQVEKAMERWLAEQSQDGMYVDLSGLERFAGVMSERFVELEEPECRVTKARLMDLEDGSAGYVRLASFYGQALKGTWQFSESLPYLRQLGVLDASKASPQVIIPNYMYGTSRCIVEGPSLSVCCRNECEAVQRRLELAVGAPEATPARLAELVVTIPSTTVSGSRTLSSVMLHRLNSIAASNGGQVPLHGRLFAQWLHHEYPRECPYPHLSGAHEPQQTEEWSQKTGRDFIATEADMVTHAGNSSQAPRQRLRHGPHETLPWSYQEELFVPRPLAAEGAPTGFALLHGAVFAAALAIATFGLLLVRYAGAARRAASAVRAPQQPQDQFKLSWV